MARADRNAADRGRERASYELEVRGGPVGVVRALRIELHQALERFAREAGFAPERPVCVELRPGIVGHHQVGRAVDIYGVGRFGIAEWARRWRVATRRATEDGGAALRAERIRNLGFRLYVALARYGRWAQPYGYPIQLFGPWTRTEGPWRYISDGLLEAHRDHIHVAR